MKENLGKGQEVVNEGLVMHGFGDVEVEIVQGFVRCWPVYSLY